MQKQNLITQKEFMAAFNKACSPRQSTLDVMQNLSGSHPGIQKDFRAWTGFKEAAYKIFSSKSPASKLSAMEIYAALKKATALKEKNDMMQIFVQAVTKDVFAAIPQLKKEAEKNGEVFAEPKYASRSQERVNENSGGRGDTYTYPKPDAWADDNRMGPGRHGSY